MLINGKTINVKDLNLPQLKALDDSIEAFIFKQIGEERFEDSYKADPKQFKRLINTMVAMKRELMAYFTNQYKNRYRLVRQPVFKADEADNSFDEYFFDNEWEKDQHDLAAIIDRYTSTFYDLGAIALAIALNIVFDHSSADAQTSITDHALTVAGDITTTTRDRIAEQIKASLALDETKAEFDQRLEDVLINPYRGRFIAQQEGLNAYVQAKTDLANVQGLTYKTALSSQAMDQICGGVNGETVPINQPFSNGLMQPTFHFGCRCDIAFSDSPGGDN